jgi:hypothetical protein
MILKNGIIQWLGARPVVDPVRVIRPAGVRAGGEGGVKLLAELRGR